MGEDEDDPEVLAVIQAKVIKLRRLANDTSDPEKRDALFRIADAIEQRARELDGAASKPVSGEQRLP
jgi:hypothetical protein